MQNLQSLFKEQITNLNSVFVFPTDIASSKWADWCVQNTSVKAVAMERFMAWDKFKGERIRGKSDDLKSVPSLMRKIFVSCLIDQNSKEHFFKNLIAQKYAENASGFVDWISSILPSLNIWKTLRDSQGGAGSISFSDEDTFLKDFYESYSANNFTDDEDSDFNLLYEKYSEFLEKNKLFDPAWVTPDFSGDGREYYLIYPETLEDWEQYKNQLSKAEHVHIVSVPENEGDYESYFFENSSQELLDVALFLREKHDDSKISWSDMAVSVPNLDDYGSYLDRTFSLYSIPHTIRYSRPLSTYGAGALFSQILECVENNFSYESVKNLLLNEDLPWTNKPTIENLLLFGRINNCICTAGELDFTQDSKNHKFTAIRTVWDEAFDKPKDDRGADINKDRLLRNLYYNLRDSLPPIVKAKTFKDIRTAYEKFRDEFFDMARFQNMVLSNNVLSRCITSLNEIIDLEEQYPDYKVTSPYSFFISQLSKVQYLSQGENRAVQVYPYRTAAAAPYKIHIVLDSTQDSLSVAESFKPLDFLNDNKRKLFLKMGEKNSSLGFSDSDPSYDFVKMYQHSSLEMTYFTASRHAYNGKYGFAYGKMEKTKEKTVERKDLYAEEKSGLLEKESFTAVNLSKDSPKIFTKQALGFSNWKKTVSLAKEDDGLFAKNTQFADIIRKRLHYLKENPKDKKPKNSLLLGKIEVTQTTLKQFFECPRKWLFKNVMNLSPLDKEAELIDEFIIGTVNHKVFENFFSKLLGDKVKKLQPKAGENEKLGDEFRKLLVSAMNEAVDSSPDAKNSAFTEIFKDGKYKKDKASTTTIKIIASQYKIEDENSADENANFRMLEKSLAHICKIYSGYTVHALEKEYQALPAKGFEGEKTEDWDGYYFFGKIDCILAGPNENEYAILDFKNGGTPSNLKVKEKVEGKKEDVIDFQMPLYIYLFENALEYSSLSDNEKPKVTSAIFYSIKNAKEKLFLGTPPNEVYKPQSIPKEEDVIAAKDEMKKKAKLFYESVCQSNFAVDEINQGRLVCTAKGEFDNCIDYQALCRRYFSVSGE